MTERKQAKHHEQENHEQTHNTHEHSHHEHTHEHSCDYTTGDHTHSPHEQDEHDHSHDHHHDHSHDHHHGHHHGHHHHHGPNNQRGMTRALLVTAGIMLLEFFGGVWSGSLALLADSAHMLSDVVAIGLSLMAMRFALRPASASQTYGFHRFEIIAALFNGVTLFVIAAFIMKEAYHRFLDPAPIHSGTMMGIAAVGLLANLLSAWFLLREGDVKGNINVRSAYLHILGDALGSVGVLLAGLLMALFSWYWADPVISVVVALLVLRSAWGVIRHTMHILMEGTPHSVNTNEVKGALLSISGVVDVHDLHIWTITSGLDSLSCHMLIEDHVDSQNVLQQAIHEVERRFRIHHATIQVEKPGLVHGDLKV